MYRDIHYENAPNRLPPEPAMSAEECFDLADHVEPDFVDVYQDVHPPESSRI